MERQTDKTTRWAFTAYEDQWPLFTKDKLDPIVVYVKYQEEQCPDTGRRHYQGALRTSRQVRFSHIRKLFPGVHIEQAKNWSALLKYVEKSDTAVAGTRTEINRSTLSFADVLIALAGVKDEPDFSEIDETDENRIKRIDRLLTIDFWARVNILLTEDPNLVGILTMPQYLRAWINTHTVWFELSARQTDKTDKPEA